jgi:hypothetical protein
VLGLRRVTVADAEELTEWMRRDYFPSITSPNISNRPPGIGAGETGLNLRPCLGWSGSSPRPGRRMRRTSSRLRMPSYQGSVDPRWSACSKL